MELTITNALAFIFKKEKKGRWLSELEARMARAAQRNLVSKTKTNKQKTLFNANKLYGLHFLVSK